MSSIFIIRELHFTLLFLISLFWSEVSSQTINARSLQYSWFLCFGVNMSTSQKISFTLLFLISIFWSEVYSQTTYARSLQYSCFLCFGVNISTSQKISFTLLLSICLLYTSPSPRDKRQSRMPSSA